MVYADKGFDGWSYRRELAERGIADGIMAGNYWRRPLMPLAAAATGRSASCGAGRADLRYHGALVRLPPGQFSLAGREAAPAAAPRRRREPAPRPGADGLRAECCLGGRGPFPRRRPAPRAEATAITHSRRLPARS